MAAACGYATLPTSPYIPDTSAERRPLMHSLLPDLRREEDKEVFLSDSIMALAAEWEIVQHSVWGQMHWLADPPDCPGGGIPPGPLGNLTKMESTAALFPKQGSKAMGLGTDCEGKKTNCYKNIYDMQCGPETTRENASFLHWIQMLHFICSFYKLYYITQQNEWIFIKTIYTIIQKFGLEMLLSLCYSPSQHVFDHKYSKNSIMWKMYFK